MQEKISTTNCPGRSSLTRGGSTLAQKSSVALLLLVSIFVGGSVEDRRDIVATESYSALKLSGRLRVAMPIGYLHEFSNNAESAGFEHDLLRRFATTRDVELEIVRVAHPQEAIDRLRQGDVHLAAGNLSSTAIGLDDLQSTSAFYERPYRIVSAPDVGLIDHPYRMVGRQVIVAADSNAIAHFKTANDRGTRFSLANRQARRRGVFTRGGRLGINRCHYSRFTIGNGIETALSRHSPWL